MNCASLRVEFLQLEMDFKTLNKPTKFQWWKGSNHLDNTCSKTNDFSIMIGFSLYIFYLKLFNSNKYSLDAQLH